MALVLVTETDRTNTSLPIGNRTVSVSHLLDNRVEFDFANSCGKNNRPDTPLPKSKSTPTQASFFFFYALILAIGLSSILVTLLFMDNLEEEESDAESQSKLEKQTNETPIISVQPESIPLRTRIKREFSHLFKLYSSLDVWLLFPLTLYATFELTFLWFEFNRAFATCLLGVNYLGWTNLFQNSLNVAFSLVMGYVLKNVGIKVGIIFTLNIGLAVNVFILAWTPSPDMVTVFLLMAGFSLSQAVSKGQITGLYGIYLDSPAAFSAFNLASPLGLLFGSLVSSYFGVQVKTYIFLGIIFLSIVSFLVLSVRHERRLDKLKSLEYENM